MASDHRTDEAKGRIKEAAGDLTNDQDLKNEGKADQMAADAKEKVEQAKDKAGDLIDKAKGAVSNDR